MAKIIKRGDPLQLVVWWLTKTITCRYCASEFVLEQGDDFQLNEREDGLICTCPVCANRLAVEDEAPNKPRPAPMREDTPIGPTGPTAVRGPSGPTGIPAPTGATGR